ncbi:hypothetical protein BJF90_09190 [Pseudonocardia sp. CNS-004]|nr:hypothetical protein BJF90_09190 [Pseudonocardia sp. CNS-004]
MGSALAPLVPHGAGPATKLIVFFAVSLALGWMGAMSGAVTARRDLVDPQDDQLSRAKRNAENEFSYKLGQLTLGTGLVVLMLAVPASVAYGVMAGIFLIGMVVVVHALRDAPTAALPRGSQKREKAPQAKATSERPQPRVTSRDRNLVIPHARWRAWFVAPGVMMIPGLLVYGAGSGTVLELLKILGPFQFMDVNVAIPVQVIIFTAVSRVAAWLLGAPELSKRLYKRFGRTPDGSGIDDAKVLLRVSDLALISIPLALLLTFYPVFPAAVLLATFGFVYIGLATGMVRMWAPTAALSSLLAAFKTLPPGIGPYVFFGAISGAVVSILHVDPVHMVLALSALYSGLGWVYTRIVVRVRVRPSTALQPRLAEELTPERARAILKLLHNAGFGDVGSLAAVLLDVPADEPGRSGAPALVEVFVVLDEAKRGEDDSRLSLRELTVLQTAITDMYPLGVALHHHLGASGLPFFARRSDGIATDPVLFAGLRAAGSGGSRPPPRRSCRAPPTRAPPTHASAGSRSVSSTSTGSRI